MIILDIDDFKDVNDNLAIWLWTDAAGGSTID